ncbi:probable galacturonosyltransferase 6 [Phtheirospermum japonicum]|uniref:Hexosyltransferase n=1 Tax=Phtheirospermum japonicum TaxID=374723 RepID=A0A830CUK4_9LAMI|nr:probable galacturonosyltransferase 6 [Phtheirospermum japonicum]
MRAFRKCSRILILCLLCVSVFVPVFLLSHRLKLNNSDASEDFVEDLSIIEGEGLKEPPLVVYKDDNPNSAVNISSSEDTSVDEVRTAANDSDISATKHDTNESGQKGHQEELAVSGAREESHKDRVQLNRAVRSSSHIVKELKLRVKEVERAMSQSTKDSRLSRSSLQKMKAMEATLLKASRIYPDCAAMITKLRAMTHNAEEQVRSQTRQENFLRGLGGRTIPKGLHCLSMRLTTEYFALEPNEREFQYKNKLQNPRLYHFAVFSDNVLACSVVVNSTISTAREPEKIVFHIVTDSLNFPAMSMWFLLNSPSKATVHVQSLDNFHWLTTKYNVTLQKEGSVDPRYISELNHLRFYLPDVFTNLNKIVFLDHDVVVRKDLTRLWSISMRGKVNGAVQTCKEGEPSFRRMDMFVNFTDPFIANRFDANACTWAFGMNIFDLGGNKRPLWKEGSLPIGLLTFYKQTLALDTRWHVLGLGHDSSVRQGDIDRASVLHFDGIRKPWLDIGFERYKHFWRKHVKYDHPYLQQCNVHE